MEVQGPSISRQDARLCYLIGREQLPRERFSPLPHTCRSLYTRDQLSWDRNWHFRYEGAKPAIGASPTTLCSRRAAWGVMISSARFPPGPVPHGASTASARPPCEQRGHAEFVDPWKCWLVKQDSQARQLKLVHVGAVAARDLSRLDHGGVTAHPA